MLTPTTAAAVALPLALDNDTAKLVMWRSCCAIRSGAEIEEGPALRTYAEKSAAKKLVAAGLGTMEDGLTSKIFVANTAGLAFLAQIETRAAIVDDERAGR